MALVSSSDPVVIFANAVMDDAEENGYTEGGTNDVENPTEFIVWLPDASTEKGYVTCKVTFERVA